MHGLIVTDIYKGVIMSTPREKMEKLTDAVEKELNGETRRELYARIATLRRTMKRLDGTIQRNFDKFLKACD